MINKFAEIINSIRVVKHKQEYKIEFEGLNEEIELILTNDQLKLFSNQLTAAIDEADYLTEQLKLKKDYEE